MTETRKNILLRVTLFSGLGIFACLLLSNYTNLPPETVARIGTWWAYLCFILIFNILGELTIRMSKWVNNMYLSGSRRRLKLSVPYAAIILTMLGLNYILFVSVKLIAGVEHPFTFPNGGFRILILVWLVELAVFGLLSANNSMQEALRLQRLSASLKEESDEAKYVALQQQLDPHFLFNSLNTLIAEIEYDPAQAVTFTRNLSDVYRYVLQSQQKKLVTLYEEINFAQSYLYLHQVRLGDCISIDTDIDKDYMESTLPPLTLQLLLENITKHNVISASKPMHIALSVKDGMLMVSNTLNPRRNNDSCGVGLQNLDNRCRMALRHGIEILREKKCFTVKIPLGYE